MEDVTPMKLTVFSRSLSMEDHQTITALIPVSIPTPHTQDHLTYEQQCQRNFKQKPQYEPKRNNNSIKSSSSLCTKQSNHQIQHPSHYVHQTQRGSTPTVELGGTPGGKRLREASTATSSELPAATSRSQDSARTTRMLLVVITLFLVTELPQGILIALSVTIPGFFNTVYIPLGDMMDQIALLNNGLNFLCCTAACPGTSEPRC